MEGGSIVLGVFNGFASSVQPSVAGDFIETSSLDTSTTRVVDFQLQDTKWVAINKHGLVVLDVY